MPGVLLQPALFIGSRSAEPAGPVRDFSAALVVTLRDQPFDGRRTRQSPSVFWISTGESRKRGRGGQNLDAIGIGPVHLGWTIVNGGYQAGSGGPVHARIVVIPPSTTRVWPVM